MPDVLDQVRAPTAPDLIGVLKQAQLNAEPWESLADTPNTHMDEYWRLVLGSYLPELTESIVSGVELDVNGEAVILDAMRTTDMQLGSQPNVVLAVLQGAGVPQAWAMATDAPTADKPTVDEFLEWLDSEDLGDDATRLRREAWGQ